MKHALAGLLLCLFPAMGQDASGDRQPGIPEAKARPEAAESGKQLTQRYLLREKGMRALDDRISAAAERFFREYREISGFEEPDFADATILLVRALLQKGAVEEAENALEYHSRNSPGVNDAYYRAGLAYWRANAAFEREQWRQTVAILEPLTRSASDSAYKAQALELAGAAHVAAGDFAEAQSVLQRLMNEHPGTKSAQDARLSLVRAYLAEGKVELASQMLEAVKQETEGTPSVRARLYEVLVLLQQGKPATAFELYKHIETRSPDSADEEWWMVLSHLSARLMAAEHYEEARLVVQRMAAVAPSQEKRTTAKLRRIKCLIELEQVELAINAMTAFRKENPDNNAAIPVQFHLARLLRESGNPLVAAEYFHSLVISDAASSELRYRAAYQRGWCFTDAGDHRSAREAFSEAARLGQTDSQQAEAFLLAGDAAFQLEEYTKAALSYQAVADNFPDSPFAERARFRQASARFNAELYGNAAVVYKQFVEEFPDSDLREQAWLERGIAVKRDGDIEAAVDILAGFAQEFPDSDKRSKALLEAALGMAALGNAQRAVSLLNRILQQDAPPAARAHALYQRVRIRFATDDVEAAIRDAWAFLEDYADLPMAADVYFWLGDHYANAGDLEESERYFRELYTRQPESPLAARALYEAARIRFSGGQMEGAMELLRELLRQFPEADPGVRARAEMLQGDILAEDGHLDEALAHFRAAHSLVPDSRVGIAALGRAGDMLMARADKETNSASLEKALRHFDAIASNPDVSATMRDKAVYRKAKVYEKMGNIDSAIAEYQDIVYGYDIELAQQKVRDWTYFVRAGVDAARLLTLQQKDRLAARVLERVAGAGVPISNELAEKARRIRQAHGLE